MYTLYIIHDNHRFNVSLTKYRSSRLRERESAIKRITIEYGNHGLNKWFVAFAKSQQNLSTSYLNQIECLGTPISTLC